MKNFKIRPNKTTMLNNTFPSRSNNNKQSFLNLTTIINNDNMIPKINSMLIETNLLCIRKEIALE